MNYPKNKCINVDKKELKNMTKFPAFYKLHFGQTRMNKSEILKEYEIGEVARDETRDLTQKNQ